MNFKLELERVLLTYLSLNYYFLILFLLQNIISRKFGVACKGIDRKREGVIGMT